jgi:hypothetical protein
MIESWRDKSNVGTVDARNGLVAEFNSSERLVELLERIVSVWFAPFTPIVESLLALVKDKQTQQEEFKRIILGMSPNAMWTALDLMYFPFVTCF